MIGKLKQVSCWMPFLKDKKGKVGRDFKAGNPIPMEKKNINLFTQIIYYLHTQHNLN